jgi:hypothetical protein
MKLYVPRDPDAIRDHVRYAELDPKGRPLPVHARESRLRWFIENAESVLATQDRLTISILSYFLRVGCYEGLEVVVLEQLPDGEWDYCQLGPDGFLVPLFQKVPSHHSLMDTIASYRTASRPFEEPEPARPELPTSWEEIIHYAPGVAT